MAKVKQEKKPSIAVAVITFSLIVAFVAFALTNLSPARRDTVEKFDSSNQPTQKVTKASSNIAVAKGVSNIVSPSGVAASNSVAESVRMINLSHTLLTNGQPQEAVNVLLKLVQTSPEEEDAWFNLGIAYTKLGKKEEAVKAYQETIKVVPDYVEPHHNLGNLYLSMGLYQEAIDELDKAIRLAPDHPGLRNSLGTVYGRMGNAREAIPQFRLAIKISTNSFPLAHYNLGNALLVAGETNEAGREFKAALATQPDFMLAKIALDKLSARNSNSVTLPIPPKN